MFNGEIELEKSEYKELVENGTVGVLFGEPDIKGTFFIGEWRENDKGRFHWHCAWMSGDTKQNHKWSENASQEDILAKVVELTAHLPPYLRDNMRRTRPEDVGQPPIRLVETVLPVDRLPAGPVTLVGDSAHSMVG